jgi:hypothetical protein
MNASQMVLNVIVGSLAVTIGCVGFVAALTAAVRGGNWLAYVAAAGCFAFVAGVIGQHTLAQGQTVVGPWDAGIQIPLFGWHLTPVALVGLLVAALGVALLLLFERVDATVRPRPELRPLDDDDSV